MAEEKRLGLREFLIDIRAVITSPRWRFPIIHDRQALWGSILLLLIPAYFPLTFVTGVYFRSDPFPGYSFALPAAVAIVMLLLKLGCLHGVARILEARQRGVHQKGSFRDLLVVFGYTGIPTIVATVIALAMFLSLPGQVGSLLRFSRVAAISLFVAAGISLFVWNMILSVLALRTVYSMRDWKIVLALLIGPAIGGALPAFVGSSVVAEGKVGFDSIRPLLSDRVAAFFDTDSSEPVDQRIGLHVDRLAYRFGQPRRFDLVAFAPAQKEKPRHSNVTVSLGSESFVGDRRHLLAGRIAGVPGDTVEVSGGRLIVNGQVWVEPYLRDEFTSTKSLPPLHVGAKEYLVLPEDRRNVDALKAEDSVITRDRIYGRLMPKKWPLGWWWWHAPTAYAKAYPAGQATP